MNSNFLRFLGMAILSASMLMMLSARKVNDKRIATADGNILYVKNEKGPTLGYSSESGVKILYYR